MKQTFIILAALFALYACNDEFISQTETSGIITVKYVTDNAKILDKGDNFVQLKGCVYEYIGDETYWFKDSTGSIKVDIDNDEMPTGILSDSVEVIIKGEVDASIIKSPEIDVEYIEKL